MFRAFCATTELLSEATWLISNLHTGKHIYKAVIIIYISHQPTLSLLKNHQPHFWFYNIDLHGSANAQAIILQSLHAKVYK